jgi:hypothetical protein
VPVPIPVIKEECCHHLSLPSTLNPNSQTINSKSRIHTIYLSSVPWWNTRSSALLSPLLSILPTVVDVVGVKPLSSKSSLSPSARLQFASWPRVCALSGFWITNISSSPSSPALLGFILPRPLILPLNLLVLILQGLLRPELKDLELSLELEGLEGLETAVEEGKSAGKHFTRRGRIHIRQLQMTAV